MNSCEVQLVYGIVCINMMLLIRGVSVKMNTFSKIFIVGFGLLFNTMILADSNDISLSAYDPGQAFDSIGAPNQVIALDRNTSVREATPLFHQHSDPVAGNARGKVTLVEFFDYQCSHCIHMSSIVRALIKDNPNLRVVFKDFPLRPGVSTYAAQAALAAKKQGKYLALHDALLKSGDSLTEEKVLALAASVGVNVNQLKIDMESSEVEEQIKAVNQLAQKLRLEGTPGFFVGRTEITSSPSATIDFINGQVAQQVLQQIITHKMA